MNTPSKPPFTSDLKPTTVRRDLDKGVTAKTPFHSSNFYHRGFKSELQPNRIGSRFCFENTNLKNRQNVQTSQRQPVQRNDIQSYVLSRLGNAYGLAPKEEKSSIRQVPQQQLQQQQQQQHQQQQQQQQQLQLQQQQQQQHQVSHITNVPPRTPHTNQMSKSHSEPSIKYQVKVNDKTYKVLRKIGSGGSAKVYEAFEPSTYQSVAIKIINVAQADPRTRENYFNEKSLLMKLQDSRHVVRIYNFEYKAELKELVIVMEKGDADLSQVIESHFKIRESMIDGIFIKFYWRGMVQAVNDIHKHGIVHADLKPVNFILVKNEIKLIDFGIASAVDPEGTSIIRDYQIGTINYMAPEALRNRATDASFIHINNDNNDKDKKLTVIKYNSKADIWSLGCILYNLVYGRPPFDKYKDMISKMQAIIDPRHVIDFTKINNDRLLNCMKSCLRYNPNDRPTAQDLLDDPYLRDDIIELKK